MFAVLEERTGAFHGNAVHIYFKVSRDGLEFTGLLCPVNNASFY